MGGALQRQLADGRALIGTVLTLPGAVTAELVAEPFDLVWVDLEHGALGAAEAQEMVLGAQAAGAYALARIDPASSRLLTAMVDAGVDGIVLASVDDADVAAAAVARTRHPPHGERGYGLRRAGTRGRVAGRGGGPPSVWAQIETRAGVAAAGPIAAVDGIDAVVVGTADLSFAVGTPREIGSEPLLEAVAQVRAAVTAEPSGTVFGVAGSLDGASPRLLDGARLLIHGTDARLCVEAADAAAARLTERLDGERRGVTT